MLITRPSTSSKWTPTARPSRSFKPAVKQTPAAPSKIKYHSCGTRCTRRGRCDYQPRPLGPAPCECFLIRHEQKAGFFFFFLWHKAEHWKNKRTVGDGDVQIALPGQLPRLVYGVLRCKNQRQASCLQPILTHDTDCDLLKTTVEKSTAVPCRAHTGCLPSAEVLLCHWKCGFNHR